MSFPLCDLDAMKGLIQKIIIVVSCAVLIWLLLLCVRLEQKLTLAEPAGQPYQETADETAAAPQTDPTGAGFTVTSPTQTETEPPVSTELESAPTAPPATDPPAPPPETTLPPETTPAPESTEPEQTTPVASTPPASGLGDTELPPV